MIPSQRLLSSIIRKYLHEDNSSKESVEQFMNRFEKENSNKDFIKNHLKVPNFRLYLTHDGDIKFRKYECAEPNKCEFNTYRFIKDMVNLNNHRYYPVSGWAFMESTGYFEHFWIYDAVEENFIDVTPMSGNVPYAYGGVINFDINDDIVDSDNYTEIPFLLGKVGYSLYKKHLDNPQQNLVKKSGKTMMDYIHSNSNYKELSNFINSYHIDNIDDLKKYVKKLKDKQSEVRNNRDYNYFEKLINQIQSIDI